MFDRKSHWQKLYRSKSALEVSWYQKRPSLSLALIQNTKIGKSEAVIDVGGGASSLVDHLHQQGYEQLSVLDISGNALASAMDRLGRAADDIEWFETDITEFEAPHQFSVWHDRAVFHFLTEQADRHKYLEVLIRSLKQGGHLIIAAFAIGGPEQCSGLDIVQYNTSKLLAELGEDFELVEELDECHTTPAGKEQKFTYFRLTKTT